MSRSEAQRRAIRAKKRAAGICADCTQPATVGARCEEHGDSLEARLRRRVDSSGGPDACWPFRGTLVNGYGTIWSGALRGSRGKMLKAHRVAWEIAVGPLPSDTSVGARGTLVLHRCDNRVCCNPTHLFLGTQMDNVRDMEAKKRAVHHAGAGNGRAKIREADVPLIRARRAAGETCAAIAADYGVSGEAIGMIALRRTWKHVPTGTVEDFCRLEDER